MRNIRLDIAYNGKTFSGWQRQAEERTIQKELEDKLSTLLKEKVVVYASGRTDAGVHARNQVVNFKTDNEKIPKLAFLYGLNSILDENIKVNNVLEVNKDFHARKSAIKKTYFYQIYNYEIQSPFYKDFYCWIKEPLDVEKMNIASKYFLGEHDFTSFAASKNSTKTTVRNIYEASWTRDKNFLIFKITGNGFLMKMVRNIVGTLIDIGLGKYESNKVTEIINDKNRKSAGKTAPACGLFLDRVYYEEYY